MSPPVRRCGRTSVFLLASSLRKFKLMIVRDVDCKIIPIICKDCRTVCSVVSGKGSNLVAPVPCGDRGAVSYVDLLVRGRGLEGRVTGRTVYGTGYFAVSSIVAE